MDEQTRRGHEPKPAMAHDAPPPLHPAEDPTDSQVVRLNFRKSMHATCTTYAVLSFLYGFLYAYLDSPWWQLHPLVPITALALRPLFLPEAPLRYVVLATLAMLMLAGGSIVWLWYLLGVDALGHFLLFSITPMIVMAGRIKLTGKLLGVILLCVLVLVLDFRGGPARVVFPNADVEQWTLSLCRTANIAVAGITAPLMLLRYFKLVCMQQAQLLDMALRDPMTQLFNRRHAHEVGEMLLKLMRRDAAHRFSVVLLDLDHFKSINDRWGHDAGDEALKHVADTLRAVGRAGDISCRWGGEEFLIVLPNTGEAAAAAFAERMRSAIEVSKLVSAGQPIPLTATLGVSEAEPEESWESIVQRADLALYAGKADGRNRVVPASTIPREGAAA